MKRWDSSQDWKFQPYSAHDPQIRKNRQLFLMGHDVGFWNGYYDRGHKDFRRFARCVVECSLVVFVVLLAAFDILLYLGVL